ncbi:RND family efflux transporter, MFP subunit [Desulfocapsa sulfexigens DSM 10523]|uniref:RND family efflux transporter, MFP subunit n=1 Tax=Desulfocapsa sulfexigens (strain DSM 10523 / SB164P1) TaxID=1167006 RepID=M1PEG5_DESSD|nr:efflux RND transporter periplasmic adaptor subunit [Desulfocapsa sulfexigens]AGF79962.1 RND family efflux transporter, MFP subunit [Desulfocapsa sulfexigens DSM 10523]
MKSNNFLGQSKPWVFILFTVCLLMGGGTAFQYLRPDEVEVIRPHRGLAVQAVYATGTVEALSMLPISPRITARLMELHVDEGSTVTKDQLLARMEDRDLRQKFEELQIHEAFLKQEFKRKQTLQQQHAISNSEYDRARTEWQAAKAAMDKAATESDFMKLIAPADGRIIRRDGEVGQLILVNQPIFWLTCCSELRVSAEVDEEDIILVQPGQKVLIRADAFPAQTFEGTVQSITPKGDPVSRSYRVRIGLSEETPLMIGMTAETNIIIRETPKALLLPSGTVVQGKVWLVEGNKLVKRTVSVGTQGLKETEILNGIEAGDLIVLKPNIALEEGVKIRARIVQQEQ